MSNPNFGEFCWNELATPSLQAAKDFYGKLLGWKFTDHNMGDSIYTMILSGEKEFGGIWQIPLDRVNEIPPHWMGYILVKNIEQTLKTAEGLGANVKMPVTKAGDFGLFAVITDPTGAHIAFWESLH
jgi:predicted enzyme related to lactoylglutathione lyase